VPALDRLSRYYNTLSELDDRNAVTVEDDQEKAKAVADWIERMALEQKVTTCAERRCCMTRAARIFPFCR